MYYGHWVLGIRYYPRIQFKASKFRSFNISNFLTFQDVNVSSKHKLSEVHSKKIVSTFIMHFFVFRYNNLVYSDSQIRGPKGSEIQKNMKSIVFEALICQIRI